MKYVLIILSGGIVEQVTFYEDAHTAVLGLSKYVRNMDPDECDAAIYGPEGLIANAKLFLDLREPCEKDPKGVSVFIIANPYHHLGFLVTTLMEPVGFTDPLKALSALEKMRREQGCTFWLYRVDIVKGPITEKVALEKYNADHGEKDFKYDLIAEYLK